MPKIIIYTLPDGSVGRGVPKDETLSAMMGSGGYSQTDAERTILFQTTVDGKKESDLRDFYNGMIHGGMSEIDAVTAIANKDKKLGWTFRVVDIGEIPPDETFRDAWEDDGKSVTVNMQKAREIHMDTIRVARNSQLAALDVPQITAIAKGDTAVARAIEAQKQQLRDIPQTLDLTIAKTPEELKAIWVDGLPR